MPDKSNIIKKLVIFVSSLLAAVWTTLIAALFFTAQDKSPFYILISAAVVADLTLILFYALKINGKPELKVRAFTSLAGAFSCVIGAYLIVLSAPAYFDPVQKASKQIGLYLAPRANVQECLYIYFGLFLAAAGVIIFLWGIIASVVGISQPGKHKKTILISTLIFTVIAVSAATIFGTESYASFRKYRYEIEEAQKYFDAGKYNLVGILLSGNKDAKSKSLLNETYYQTGVSDEGFNIIEAKKSYIKLPVDYKDVKARLDKINKYEKYFGWYVRRTDIATSIRTYINVKNDEYQISISGCIKSDTEIFTVNEEMTYESSYSVPNEECNVKITFIDNKLNVEYYDGKYETPVTEVFVKERDG